MGMTIRDLIAVQVQRLGSKTKVAEKLKVDASRIGRAIDDGYFFKEGRSVRWR